MKSNYDILGSHIRLIDNRNKESITDRVLGINIDKYFMPSVANVIGTDLSKYKLISKGKFACNPMHVGRDERLPVALYDEDTPALISPAYFMFEVVDNSILNEDYLMMWFSRPEFDRICWLKTDGSVRGGISWDDICRLELPVPPIEEQLEIVNSYKAITERIDLKQKINDNLEEQVYALYKQLTQVHDPNTVFESIATVQSGKRPVSNKIGNYPLVGAGGIMSYINDYNFDEQILITGRVGTHGVIQRFFSKCWASDNTLVIKSDYYEFSYHFLKSVDWDLLNRGSTQPLVTQTDIKNLPLYLPNISELTAFEATAEKIMKHQRVLLKEIESLNKLKDMIITSLSKY